MGEAHPITLYCVFVTALLFGVLNSTASIVRISEPTVTRMLTLGDGGGQSTEASSAPKAVSVVLEGDEWLQNLKSTWSSRSRSDSKPSNLGNPAAAPGSLSFGQPGTAAPWWSDDALNERAPVGGRSKTHRTMCVRLCDGYYFPVSFAATSDRFEDEERACQRNCSTPAKLYVYRNPGQEPEDMVNLNGQPYKKLANAFLFRTKLDQACKCNPHPWEQEATDRHRKYAEDAARIKTQRQAALDATAAKTGKSAKGRTKTAPVAADASPPPAKRADISPPPVPAMTVSTGTRIALLNAATASVTNAPTAEAAPPASAQTATASPAPKKAQTQQGTTHTKSTKSRPATPQIARAGPTPTPAVASTAPSKPMRLGAATAVVASTGAGTRPAGDWRQKVFAAH